MEHPEQDGPVNRIPHGDDDRMTEEKAQRILGKTFEQLRRFSDRALVQIVIADGAVEVAERATRLVSDRDDSLPLDDVEQAARLVADAQELLNATVLAARLRGKSWKSIGYAVTGSEDDKKQTMANRFGHLEDEWKAALIEPEVIDREAWDGRGTVVSNIPDALSWTDLGKQINRLHRFLETHSPDRTLNLPDQYERLTTDIGDYTWRLNAAIEKYGVAGIPPALAADLDIRKRQALADGQAYLDAAERAARRPDETGEES